MKVLRSRVEYPPQRSVPWTLKDVATTRVDFQIPDDRRFRICIRHDIFLGGQYE